MQFNLHISRVGATRVELLMLSATTCLGVGFLLSALAQSHETQHRLRCAQHLHELGEAMQGFESVQGRLPANYWAEELSPHLEREGPPSLPFIDSVYRCPARGNLNNAIDYATGWVGGSGAAPFPENHPICTEAIPDGASNTMLLGERNKPLQSPVLPPGIFAVDSQGIYGEGSPGIAPHEDQAIADSMLEGDFVQRACIESYYDKYRKGECALDVPPSTDYPGGLWILNDSFPPQTIRFDLIRYRNLGFGSRHASVMNVLMYDGAVRPWSYRTTGLGRLISPNDGAALYEE